MTALPGWPAVSGAATFQHIRRALAGNYARDAAGALRKGILPAHATALVTGTATMNVAVAAFIAVTDRNGAVLVANDGSVNVLLSSAPGSGSRWSVVYLKQRESEAPFSDGADGPVLDKVESTTSEAAARALLPAGALELAVVQVNSGSANTNAVGVTITQTYLYTAAAGGAVWVRNATELAAWTPADGASAFRMDTGTHVTRVGGTWKTAGLVPFGAGGALVGSGATNDTRMLVQGGTRSGTANGSSVLATAFPVAFPNGVISVVATPADATTTTKQVVTNAWTVSGFDGQCLTGGGAGIGAVATRYNWIAIGW